MFSIKSLNQQLKVDIQTTIDNKTKPPGALGLLENCALQLALIQNQKQKQKQSQSQAEANNKLVINEPTMLVFAGDHGIAQHGISIAPSAVTRQMVLNFIAGGAAINCFCRTNEIHFKVIDTGIIEPLTTDEQGRGGVFIEQRLGLGTKDFSIGSAMSPEQVDRGLTLGGKVAEQTIKQGCNLLLLGEMGIGNTSAAAAIFAALTQQTAAQCVGAGTGIDELQLAEKKRLIDLALARDFSNDPKVIMAEFGGFEIVQMVGAILAAAQAGIAVLIDGFIVTSAALLAYRMHPEVREYLLFAHQSNEQAHLAMLSELNAKPLLNLGLRLGEGTGAALALPLLQASVSFYNDMASFSSAGVTV